MAERLGMTARELGERMGHDELEAWIQFDQVNRHDSWYQTALICCAIHWAMGFPNARMEDFLPPPRQLGPDGPAPGLEARIMAWARGHNRKLGLIEAP